MALDHPSRRPAGRRRTHHQTSLGGLFFDGNHDAVIETLPGCSRTDQPGYPPITIADNINAKLAGMKQGIAPKDAQREAQRLTSAHSGR